MPDQTTNDQTRTDGKGNIEQGCQIQRLGPNKKNGASTRRVIHKGVIEQGCVLQ
jgi:hypothetical protein